MKLLFLLALLLAWPTYGISLIVWLTVHFISIEKKTDKIDAGRETAILLEPLFTNQQADFFNALEVPLKPAIGAVSHNDAHQCGRHIMNYIAHNPGELLAFVSGLKRWASDDGQMCHPVAAVHIERRLGRGDVLAVSLRAIEAIVTHNPNLQCFQSIDLARLKSKHLKVLGTA
jgi:hypothetical protein